MEQDDADKQNRTITFGDFSDDTKSEAIIDTLNKMISSVKDNIDEVFAYGKKWATRGAVRFKTEASMWSYLKDENTKSSFDFSGTKIYTNRAVRDNPEDEGRVKAVRKLVRAIIEQVIEHEGATGEGAKKEIDANYRKGIVRYKDVRVGEYKIGKMELKNDGTNLESRFNKLME